MNRLLIVVLILLIIPFVWFLGIKGLSFGEFWSMIEGYFGRGKNGEQQDG